MLVEISLLLLPVAAASGWFAALRSQQRKQAGEAPCIKSPEYFKGLNYVLNEQPDKAIDVFVKMVEVDGETVETHLALGNLFRRRGEVDRAIRIHQNLISRDSLTPLQRAQSLLELGQDYFRAGLFDRAENLFNELVDSGFHREQALQNLRAIYEQEKEWDKCLETAQQLASICDDHLHTERAHYFCEKAELARAAGDTRLAVENLNRARNCHETCVRATILLGRIEMDEKKWQKAAKTLWRVEKLDYTYFSVVLPDLTKCYQQTGTLQSFRDELQQVFKRRRGRTELLVLTDLIQASEGDEIALSFLSSHLQKQASLEGLERLITLDLKAAATSGDHTGTLRIIRPLISQLLKQHSAYLCNHCGFTAKELHWQCPSCKTWHSIKPD